MHTLEYDLHYIQFAAENLEGYLLSKDIYWPVRAETIPSAPPYPQLTLGNLLLSCLRAEARANTASEKSDLLRIRNKIETVHQRWRVAWENKARSEFRARLRLWVNYLDDYQKNPDLHYSRYTYEVGRRVLLQLLEIEARALPEKQISLISELDALVRFFLIEGEFIWSPELSSSFPKDPYWYLYGYLPEELVSAYR